MAILKNKALLKYFLISVSVFAHGVLFVAAIFFIEDRVTSHWRWASINQIFSTDKDAEDVYSLNSNDYQSLPKNRWLKIHQQKSDDSIRFVRQAHAGSSFDTKRGQLIVFGSDTHSRNWNNAIYTFDMATRRWSESYEPDSPDTYTVNAEGVPVAGNAKNHPWAMHTFGAIEYDVSQDQLVVASYPGHLAPKNYGKQLASVWKKIKHHPTWLYDFKKHQWISRVTKKNVHFFPYATAYDSHRHVVTGFRPNGIFEWRVKEKNWVKVAKKAYSEWHTNVTYDSLNRQFVLYGGNEMTNNTYTYKVGDSVIRKMPENGARPPGGQSIPLAFHEKLGKVIALVDDESHAQTWLYDSAENLWERAGLANFPYNIGMSYSLVYDSSNNLLVLVSSPANEETAVWVLKLEAEI